MRDEASDAISNIGGKLKTGLATAGKVAATGIGLVTAAAGAAAGALMSVAESTEEYRIAQGKLNTAFEAAGFSAETATEAYNGFYGILGDTDTATEASQLLAKLADSAEDVSTWTNIAAGVNGTFGDSLPIEGLIEASNETAKVGTVTGVLADALNWAGISEDEFNLKLAACSSESERNQLIMTTLSETYDDAADAFYRNNEALVAAREAQAQMDASLAKLGQAVSNVVTNVTAEFLPAVSQMTEGLAGMLSGTEGADEQFSAGLESLLNTLVSKLPEFLDFGVQIVMSLVDGLLSNLDAIVDAATQIVLQLAYQIIEMLPQLAESALQIILQLATFLTQSLPELVPAIVEIVLEIVDVLLDNLDLLVDAAIELTLALAEGLIEALPMLIDKAPEIISKLASALIEEGPKILEAAVELMVMLSKGLLEGFVSILGYIGGWAYDYLIQPLLDEVSAFVDIGRQLISGLWSGIEDSIGWLKSKASGLIDSFKGVFTDGFDIHSPSKWFSSIGQYMMDGLAVGLMDSAGEVMETVEDIVGEVKTRFSAMQDIFTTRQDISDLEYQLWEGGEGRNATEAEKYLKQLELLGKQQQDQQGIVEAAVAAYQAVVEQYGENAQESYSYQKTLLEEQLELQNLQNEIYDTITAMQELSKAQGSMSSVSFGDSGLGIASSATINANQELMELDKTVELTANLVTPDGAKLATWQLPFLIKAGSAAGTPIAEAQRA